MKKSIISLFIGLVCVTSLTTSCEDMLTPDMERYALGFTGKDTVNFYSGILRGIQQITEQNILLGELRGDLIVPTQEVSDSISDIANFKNLEDGENNLLNAAAYYKIINQCNYYLRDVDSTSCNNNYYYMHKETAQVLLIRAWTYMQLVQNYGKVPFITDVVANSSTGWETNPKDWATADNLVDLLHNDMEQAWAYCEAEGYPDYSQVSAFNTGLESVNHKLLNFDADVIYGDLYLLRGQSTADFEMAAEHYYNFLYKNERTGSRVDEIASTRKNKLVNPPTFTVSSSSWKGDASMVSYSFGGNPIVTGVPSAANSHFGLVLSRIPNIYGFDIHSGNLTETGTDADGNEQVSTTGSISVKSNYRVRQVEPSPAYVALSKAQTICVPTYEEGSADMTRPMEVDYPTDCTDGRIHQSAPLVETQDMGRIRFISKFCGNYGGVNPETGIVSDRFSFRYLLPLYRYRTVMLRYAEALNRAGFPGHAFAIIRDGLCPETYPMIALQNDTIVVADSTVYAHYVLSPQADEGPNYISDDEMARAWNTPYIKGIISYGSQKHVGIREAGTGESIPEAYDTIYTYKNQIAQRLSEEDSRLGTSAARRYVKLHEGEEDGEDVNPDDTTGTDPVIDTTDFEFVIAEPKPADPAEMRAMELIIADQYALETAFEGQRYYDMMRIARHLDKIEGNNYGTEWLAWKISRRDLDLKPYENPTQKGTLYNTLLDQQNWYLPLPNK